MRKELNFQSGTDAESSLKLDLNSVIAELTESVTKQAPKITGKSSSATGSLEKQAYDLDKAVTDTKSLVAGAEGVQKTLEHDFAASGNKAVAEIKIPEYKDALGKTVPEVVIALGAVITSANSNQMKDAVAALKTTHDAAVKAEATFQAKTLPVVV